MKENTPIAQQVEALTEEQKNTVVKVDTYAKIILLILAAPGIAMLVFGGYLLITKPEAMASGLLSMLVTLLISLAMLCVMAVFFLKTKYPYYSMKKASYIRKIRKNKA